MYLPAGIDLVAAKEKFAEAVLRNPKDLHKAAMSVFPQDTRAAMFIMRQWMTDDYVLEVKQKLIDTHGEEYFLPTLYDLSHEVYYAAAQAESVDEKIKAYKLYAEIRGMISKPQTNIQVNNNDMRPTVMLIENVEYEDIEKRQAKLLREMAEDLE